VKLVRAYLLGSGRNETAETCSVSGGYVSKIWDTFKAEIGPEGERLREISIQLTRDNITVEQAVEGANIDSLLRKMKVDEEEFEGFISKFCQTSTDLGYSPEQVSRYAIELSDLYAKTGIRYEKLIKEYVSKKEETSKLEQQIKELKAESAKAKAERDSALSEKKATIEDLNEYVEARSVLAQFSQDIRDVRKLSNMLKSGVEQDFDMRNLIVYISEVGDVSSKLKELKFEVSNIERRKVDLLMEVAGLEKTKSRAEASISMVTESIVPQIRKASKEVEDFIAELKEDIKVNTKEINENAKREVSELKSLTVEPLEKLQGILDRVNPAIERLSKAEELGEQVGRFDVMWPLLKLVEESKGSKYEVLPAMRIMLDVFGSWLKDHPVGGLIGEQLKSLITSMDSVMRLE
jgi:hypothetical protein